MKLNSLHMKNISECFEHFQAEADVPLWQKELKGTMGSLNLSLHKPQSQKVRNVWRRSDLAG